MERQSGDTRTSLRAQREVVFQCSRMNQPPMIDSDGLKAKRDRWFQDGRGRGRGRELEECRCMRLDNSTPSCQTALAVHHVEYQYCPR